MNRKHDPKKLFLETYNYNVWFENEELPDTRRKMIKKNRLIQQEKSDKEDSADLFDMPPLEGDE